MMNRRYWQGLLVLVLGSMLSMAQADGVRIRGTLTALQDHVATVKTQAGEVAHVHLANPYKVLLYKNIRIDEIPVDAYVSIPSVPITEGKVSAISVNVFPEAMRGYNEGFTEWDLSADSKMTNATVAKVVGLQDDATLTVNFLGESQLVVVDDSTPVTTFDVAPDYSLEIGQSLVFFAEDKDSRFSAAFIGVWENGKLPPI